MDVRISWLITAGIGAVLVWLAFSLSGGGGQPGATAVSPSGAPQPPAAGQPAGADQVADQPAIEELLHRTFTENDPKQCTQDLTPAFLRFSFGSEKGTLDRCRRRNTRQSETSAKSITVNRVIGRGSSATAVITASSSNTLDGSVLTVSLVRQGGRWKLDSFDDIQIDRPRFDQHLSDDLGARGYLPAETTCAIGKLDRTVSSDQIERNVISGDSSYDYINSASVSCLSRSTLLRELGQGITAVLSERGVPSRVTSCVVDRLTHGVPIGRLRHLLAAGARSSEAWYRLGYQASLACAGSGPSGAAGAATT
jgi:hypothetical protein